MASRYTPNKWEIFSHELPPEIQVNSYITKRRLDRMEQGIHDANIPLEVGSVKIGTDENYGLRIEEDTTNNTRRIHLTFPPAGKGDPGKDGESAYHTWISMGNIGTKQDFIDYLKGIDGKDGKDGKDGIDGSQGPVGESAYQSWLALGNTGSMEDFLRSLKGDKGETGETGLDNYELWKSIPGNENKSLIEYFESLKGEQGVQGPAGKSEFVDF